MPQIELMQADLPHTLYLHDKEPRKPEQNTKASDEVIRRQEEANRRAAERRAKKQKEQEQASMTVEEIFQGNQK